MTKSSMNRRKANRAKNSPKSKAYYLDVCRNLNQKFDALMRDYERNPDEYTVIERSGMKFILKNLPKEFDGEAVTINIDKSCLYKK